jgi:glutamate--cysteine ligase
MDDLLRPFFEAEHPRAHWRVGVELEKFGVDARTFLPLQYEDGVTRILDELEARGRWQPEREHAQGPVIALKGPPGSVTLEPGAQVELSASPVRSAHDVRRQLDDHQSELAAVSAELGLEWLAIGFHPFARPNELPWVPKQRYSIMREYLPTRGSGALDMMRRTATVQANYDFANEEDAFEKLGLLLKLAPVLSGMTANSPFFEGRVSNYKSVRGEVWSRMDPERSGLMPLLWSKKKPRYVDYVEWALDAGMFLIKRNGRIIGNSGQSFRSFLLNGFQGHRATHADWKLHLSTLFPDVRLRNTIELRTCDALPHDLATALVAMVTSLIYDDTARSKAAELVEHVTLDEAQAAKGRVSHDGLAADFAGRTIADFAVRLLELAAAGLERRALSGPDGKDERTCLRPLEELVDQGMCPADKVARGLSPGDAVARSELVARTRL